MNNQVANNHKCFRDLMKIILHIKEWVLGNKQNPFNNSLNVNHYVHHHKDYIKLKNKRIIIINHVLVNYNSYGKNF